MAFFSNGSDTGLYNLGNVAKEAYEMAMRGRSAQRGIYRDGNVQVGTKTYPCKLVVDIPLRNGSVCYCQITDNDRFAIIVGM